VVGRDRRARGHERPDPWSELAQAQCGVVSRAQLRELGLSDGQIGALLDARRWTGLLPGVYATFRGPVPAVAHAWAAVLNAGFGACLGGRTALWLWGVLDAPPPTVTVCVPGSRKVVGGPGVVVVRRRTLWAHEHPVATPPRLRIEDAVIDVAQESDAAAIDVVLRATQRRLTTPERLRQALACWSRHPRRALLKDLLEEVRVGVQSALERRYLHGVERAHGLPRSERNHTERAAGEHGRARNRYRDNRYRPWGLVVELDGEVAHPGHTAFRERRRDNRVVVGGDTSLSYGWVEVVTDPCGVAADVAAVLTRLGWTGRLRRCGPDCTADATTW
jgi:hypothetical protein